MSFIGNKPDSFGYTSTSYEQFSGNDSDTTFTLSKYVTNSSDIQVVVNNVIQEPGVAYSVIDLNSLVFTSAPSTGTDNIYVVYKNFIQTGLGFAANSVGSQTIAPGSVQDYHFGNISIPNSSLSNSSITINGTQIGLGQSGSIPGANVTNIPNSSLSNSSITINGTQIGLGSSGSIIAGATITDDVSTNATRYVMLGSATSGAYTSANVSSTKLTFNPSTGILGSVGLKFPASQSASADANTLDDYEEGTWTPVWQSSGSIPTLSYSVQSGRYVKIGRVVHFWARVFMNSWSSGGSGNMRMGGLPFTADNYGSGLGNALCHVVYTRNSPGNQTWPTGATQIMGQVKENTTYLEYISLGGSTDSLGESAPLQWNTNPQMYNNFVTGSYFTNS